MTPLEAELEQAGWQRAPTSTAPPVSPGSATVLRRTLLSPTPSGARLEHEPGVGVSVVGPRETVTARWADVVGVGVTAHGEHLVQVADGATVPLSPRGWRGLGPVLDDLREHVPPRLVFPLLQ